MNLARKRTGCRSRLANAGWAYDMLPDLPTLDAGKTITLAELEGPGMVTGIHFTQHIARLEDSLGFILDGAITSPDQEQLTRRHAARGLVLEIYYDHSPIPAVCCPLADFFADGCGGKAINFTSPLVEKLPESYNCFFPMPFREHIQIDLRNETPYNLLDYCCVEYESLPVWTEELLYFYATWKQVKFQLTPDTILPLFQVQGCGHLIGQQFSIRTPEPAFGGFFFVMEGNPCYRLDREEEPSIIYTGMEDSFGFSWGFRQPVSGAYNGINHLQIDTLPNELSIYRFRPTSPLIFEKSLDLEINWAHEFSLGQTNYATPPRKRVYEANRHSGGWVCLEAVHYWYADRPDGYPHQMADYAARLEPLQNLGNDKE